MMLPPSPPRTCSSALIPVPVAVSLLPGQADVCDTTSYHLPPFPLALCVLSHISCSPEFMSFLASGSCLFHSQPMLTPNVG